MTYSGLRRTTEPAFINADLAADRLHDLVRLAEEAVARAVGLVSLVQGGTLIVDTAESGVAAEDAERLG